MSSFPATGRPARLVDMLAMKYGNTQAVKHYRCNNWITRDSQVAWTCRYCMIVWTEEDILQIDRISTFDVVFRVPTEPAFRLVQKTVGSARFYTLEES